MRVSPQRASLYQRGERILTYPEHQTVAGFYISGEPYEAVADLDPQSVGEAVLRALEDSRTGVAELAPDEWGALARRRLEAAGARSESAFMRGAKLVSIERRAELLQIIPHKNGGASGNERGFLALEECASTVSVCSREASVGAACVEALSKCL